jgi:sporulation protein YlmC with PRC-barrel domain
MPRHAVVHQVKKMTKRFRYFALLLSLALALVACQLTQQGWKQIAEPASLATGSPEKDTPTDNASQAGQADPAETQAPVKGNPDPSARDKPLQSQAAEIQPNEMRTKLTHLSNLLDYRVLDENADTLGVASDYIVNTCEGYIIYILMEPEASLNVTPGSRVVIPFEAVTINSGVLDAQNEAIQLRLNPEQFSGAPTFPAGQQLTPTDWEGAARAFWSKAVRIGKLATSCNVSGGPVYKVAYATQLLGVELYDGQNNLLGDVQEVLLEPESGNVGFYIVKPAKGDGLVMVHLRATNIPKEALLPGSALTLVLLTDPQVFWDAPQISRIDEADDFALQSKMRQYWGR